MSVLSRNAPIGCILAGSAVLCIASFALNTVSFALNTASFALNKSKMKCKSALSNPEYKTNETENQNSRFVSTYVQSTKYYFKFVCPSLLLTHDIPWCHMATILPTNSKEIRTPGNK